MSGRPVGANHREAGAVNVSKVLIVFGTACFVAAASAFFGALWWWAVLGMDKDVGSAWIATVLALPVVGVIAFAVGAWMEA